MLKHRCGLRLAPPGAHVNFFARDVAPAALPPVPAVFGHQSLIPAKGWGMLANDEVGDCTIAGPMHVEMLWNKIAGRSVRFTALDALDDYSANSGYVQGNPLTDVGCDMVAVAKYWQAAGMRDCTVQRHKIAAWLSVDPKNLQHIYLAAYLFGAVGLGITVPDSVDAQFENGRTWSVVADATDGDYHFVPAIARGPQGIGFVTWGQFCWMTEQFLKTYCSEAVVYLTQENLVAGKSPGGINYSHLLADLPEVA